MKKRRSQKGVKRLLADESGQAMTEAVVTLSLLCMTWILLFYCSFMGNNRVRCIVAARHAAWGAGNEVTVDQNTVRNAVFWTNTDQVTLATGSHNGSSQDNPNVQDGLDGAGGGGIMGTVINTIVGFIRTIFPPIHTADVTFGVADSAGAAGVFPFIFMNTRFPYMEDSDLGFFSVTAHAEWDEVSNTWKDLGEILQIDDLF